MEMKSLYPLRNCEFEIVDGLVIVNYFNKKPSFIEKLFFKKQLNKPYKIDLDEIGSFVWQQCSGENNIEKISSLAEAEFGEKVKPASERVELFIKQMEKNKLIKLYEKVKNEDT